MSLAKTLPAASEWRVEETQRWCTVRYGAAQSTLCSMETNIKGKYVCEKYSLSKDIQFQSSEGSLFSLGKV